MGVKGVKMTTQQNSIPEPNSGCWLWLGSWSPDGYGKTKRGAAHREAWEEAHGVIPKGMLVCHKCDTPACVNPGHLFLGSYRDNAHDAMRKGRHVYGERNGRSKIDAQTARIIFSFPFSSRITAAKFGLSPATVKAIRRGRLWKQATGVSNA